MLKIVVGGIRIWCSFIGCWDCSALRIGIWLLLLLWYGDLLWLLWPNILLVKLWWWPYVLLIKILLIIIVIVAVVIVLMC